MSASVTVSACDAASAWQAAKTVLPRLGGAVFGTDIGHTGIRLKHMDKDRDGI